MSILEIFIEAYHEKFPEKKPEFDEGLAGEVTRTKHLLLDERFSPPPELDEILMQLQARTREPMKVAITGQFSSGKSTFLNALLSRNVLPTGITPVTSKVNYIRYGDTFQIRVRYKDGRDAYLGVEHIAKFTDQRGVVEEIDYLTLYAPLEMLREITFVDTPGLNSQDEEDTATTQNVLREVDGIIWLSLIDNAGKMSEAQTLEKYMDQYQGKTLCVLNQKDRFTPEQVAQSVSYVRQGFSKYFSEVVPISARDALISRSHDKHLLLEEAQKEFLEAVNREITALENPDLTALYQAYQQRRVEIQQRDPSQNREKLEASNIAAVLDFIEREIRPVSESAKAYAIRRELVDICERTAKQHRLFIRIHDELLAQLHAFESEAEKKLAALKESFGKELGAAYLQIEEIIAVIAEDIYRHLTQTTHTRYVPQKTGLLKRTVCYEAHTYKCAKIDADQIYKYLFFEEDIVGKMFKKYVKNLKRIQDEVNLKNAEVYEMLKKRIRQWQSPYELLRKQDIVHSYIEFANSRKFASKAYEHLLKPFSDQIHHSYAKVSSEFNHLSSAVSFNYLNATQVSIAFFEQKIAQSVALYEKEPERFSPYTPKLDEIKERLRSSFHLYTLQNMMDTKQTFLSKNYDTLMREFKAIKQDREAFIQKRKARHEKMIALLHAHIDGIKKDEER